MKLFLPLLLLFASSLGYAQQDVDVLHYQFEIGLSDRSDSLFGSATIRVQFKAPSDLLVFDLAQVNKQGKGMHAYTCFVDSAAASSTQVGNKLEISLPQSVAENEIKTFTISYKGIPADGLIISKTKYGRRSFFADNWPNRGHNWLPCIDDPGDKATVDFIVTAPQHYQVVANGVQVEESNLVASPTGEKLKRTHWKEDVPLSTKVMVIGVAEFAVSLAGTVNDCIPVYSWVYPEDRDNGFYEYAMANEILPFFISKIGPYGYKKLANVQSKTTFGGLENANTIFYHENSTSGSRKSVALMAHEIAHQWFGDMATEKSFAHLWLSEGFATYMTIFYMESKFGKDTALAMLREDRDQVIAYAKKSDRPVVDDTKDYLQLLNANSYQKGGWVLHMLRSQIGDSVFWKAIRNYYATFAGRNADTRDLQKIFEQAAGKSLSVFFQQWLFTPGVPHLDISWQYLANEKKLSLTIKQTQKTPFSFPLEIALKTASGKTVTKTITVDKSLQTISIPVNEKVTGIVADPRVSLLFDYIVKESM